MPKSPPRRRAGRPTIEITPAQVMEAGRFGLDHSETAAILGCSLKTLQRRLERAEFREAYERGHSLKNVDTKMWLRAAARNGSVRAMTFIAQNEMGWSEKSNATIEQNTHFVVEIPAPLSADEWTQVYGGSKPVIDVIPARIGNAPEKP
jgi:hypothetical protein